MKALQELGWDSFFERSLMKLFQRKEAELANAGIDAKAKPVARVMAVQRNRLTLLDATGEFHLPLAGRWFTQTSEARPTVGDWVLLSGKGTLIEGLLERKTLIKRLAPGGHREVQLIAANLDTLFIVTSCDEEFSQSRLERYLALAFEAAVRAVVVLTKIDLCEDHLRYVEKVREVKSDQIVEAVNALDAATLTGLRVWCRAGHTVALVGSSGVGKSTLVNSLSGEQLQDTGGVRAQDKRGRHTTSHRSLHRLRGGGLLLDSPGIRELHLAAADTSSSGAFEDIEALAKGCRFSDCGHKQEPGCAIRVAIEAGSLDQRRWSNYLKLQREQKYAAETVAERHQRNRQFARMVRHSQIGKPTKRH